MKARLYRFFALAFALFGVAIFLILYFRHVDGRLLDALANIKTVVIILVPFLPAAVLTMMAARAEDKFYDLLHSGAPPEDEGPPKKDK